MGLREAVDDDKATSNGSDNRLNFSGSIWENLWSPSGPAGVPACCLLQGQSLLENPVAICLQC